MLLVGTIGFPAAMVAETRTSPSILTNDPIAHGGGCRKNSPAGQCCHLQKSTGTVHCH
jgi:hypothetical protein